MLEAYLAMKPIQSNNLRQGTHHSDDIDKVKEMHNE